MDHILGNDGITEANYNATKYVYIKWDTLHVD